MLIRYVVGMALCGALGGCATSNIQPMARDTFKVSTYAAPACGATGARQLAYKITSVEVIKRGGDRFVIVGDQSGDSFSYWSNNFNQGIVARMIPQGSPEFANALSAREELGPNWQEIVNRGAPVTCT